MAADEIKIYCDGGSRGNPGPAASAIVVKQGGKQVFTRKRFIGDATNNTAEYQALLMALGWLTKKAGKAPVRATVFMDSELVVKQVHGVYKVKSKNIVPLIRQVKEFESSLASKVRLQIKHIKRGENHGADALVNAALNEAATLQ